MTIDDHADDDVTAEALQPDRTVLVCGFAAVALISMATLPWPHALASTILGTLMVAGADIDARNFLLPDIITGSALFAGLVATTVLDPFDRWSALTTALGGAILVGAALWLMRQLYQWLRKREGLGLGDVKLAAAVGAWLPLDTVPLCFALATSAALIAVLLAWLRDRSVARTAKLPFGAFLCPALWLVDYAVRLQAV
ncbi:A24 family peptidase [Bradyrhizobium sp. Ai1a-2]|uniref:prepilin peptidase n=1 Tax=Bradyrhizobium sp. Ai1a-2 TaxID=196490 RepID=UPI000425C012|nr:A24 family peptidase [Bradyrhizobium sp. Ai1a-2]